MLLDGYSLIFVATAVFLEKKGFSAVEKWSERCERCESKQHKEDE